MSTTEARTADAEPIVRIIDLHKSFGLVEILKGVDLDVHRGQVVVVLGRSGSGKSTMLRCVNHLERPSRGTVTSFTPALWPSSAPTPGWCSRRTTCFLI